MIRTLRFFTSDQRTVYNLPPSNAYTSPFRNPTTLSSTNRLTAPDSPSAPFAPLKPQEAFVPTHSRRIDLFGAKSDPSPKPITGRVDTTPPSSSRTISSAASSSLTNNSNPLFTPPAPLGNGGVFSTPKKILDAIARRGRLLMWSYDENNPSPSTIQVKLSPNNCIERVYPLEPQEIREAIADHAELRNQLAYLALYVYHHHPYADQIKVSRPEGLRTTFQLGHTIDSNYSSAHASCTPRIRDSSLDAFINDLRQMDLAAFHEKKESIRSSLKLLFLEEISEQKLNEIEQILSSTKSSRGNISLENATKLEINLSQIKFSIQNEDRYMESCRAQYIARLELAKQAINEIQDSLSTQVPYITNEFSALGLTTSKARDIISFIKDSIRILESKKDFSLQNRIDKLRIFLNEMLKNFRDEHKKLEDIASSFDIEINKHSSIDENKAAIFREILLKQAELKDKASNSSLNLKRTILYKNDELIKKATNLTATSSPFSFPVRAHDVGNRLQDLKKEISCFEELFLPSEGQTLCTLSKSLFVEMERELSETRSFRLEKSLIGYFSSPEEFSYPLGGRKGMIMTKRQHEDSAISHTSHLFHLLNTTNDLPYYVNRMIDASVEHVLQDELLSIINNEKSLSLEEKYRKFDNFSKNVFQAAREKFAKCQALLFQLHDNYAQIYTNLENLHRLCEDGVDVEASRPILQKVGVLYNEYMTRLHEFESVGDSGFLLNLSKDLDFLLNGNGKLPTLFQKGDDNLEQLEESLGNREELLSRQLLELSEAAKREAEKLGEETELTACFRNHPGTSDENLLTALHDWVKLSPPSRVEEQLKPFKTKLEQTVKKHRLLKNQLFSQIKIAQKKSLEVTKLVECLQSLGISLAQVEKSDFTIPNQALTNALKKWLKDLPPSDPAYAQLNTFLNPSLQAFFSRPEIASSPILTTLLTNLSLGAIDRCTDAELLNLKNAFFAHLKANPIDALSLNLYGKSTNTKALADFIQRASNTKLEHAELPGYAQAVVDIRRTIEAFDYQIFALNHQNISPLQLAPIEKDEAVLINLLAPRYRILYEKEWKERGGTPRTIGLDRDGRPV